MNTKPSMLTLKSHICGDKGDVFISQQRDQIGDNRKIGTEAKQIGEKEMKDRQTETHTGK